MRRLARTHSTRSRLFSLLAACALLAGCVAPGEPAPEPVASPAPPPVVEPDEGIASLSPGAHWRTAIELLERGQPDTARSHLQRVIAARGWGRPRAMLRELDVDPDAYLGAQSFAYTVAAGDSLSLIAERFLGDKLKFYILARYNGIANPSLVSVGQQLRIPSRGAADRTTPSEPTTAGEPTAQPDPTLQPTPAEPAATVEDPVARATALLEARRFEAAALEADNLDEAAGSSRLRERIYLAWARDLQGNGRLEDAQVVLERGAQAVPDSTRLSARAADVRRLLEADRYLREGLRAEQAGNIEGYEQAFELYRRGLEVTPRNLAVTQRREQVRGKLVEAWYRLGTERYRQQSLEESIAAFDRVLELDAGNERAQAQRAQAVEAARRLKDLEEP